MNDHPLARELKDRIEQRFDRLRMRDAAKAYRLALTSSYYDGMFNLRMRVAIRYLQEAKFWRKESKL